MDELEQLVVNVKGKAKRRTLFGREYLVANMTLIVPGVLAGSAGPLYYPPEEVSRYPEIWNHKPITLNHPDGSTSDPDVLNNTQLGFVLNTRFVKGKLVAEGWFDVHRVSQVEKRIITNLVQGTPFELSTGLGVDFEQVENGNHNGIPYVAITKNYRPDHLAILIDGVGACSIKDGCGVLISNEKETTMASEAIVKDLITNCDCWTDKHKDVLLNMEEEDVKKLLDKAKAAKRNELVANAAKAGFEGHVWNEEKQTWEKKEDGTKEKKDDDKTPITNKATEFTKETLVKGLKELTPEEWFDVAPPEVQEVHNSELKRRDEYKKELVDQWVENADKDQKESAKTWAESQKVETLEAVLNQLPKRSTDNPYSGNKRVGNYAGAVGGVSNAYEGMTKPEPLGLPVWQD